MAGPVAFDNASLPGSHKHRDERFNSDTPYVASQHVPTPASQLSRDVKLHPSNTFPDASEQRLRRKTPNGTIDAAYDASTISPGGISCTFPPLKHVALSATSAQSSLSRVKWPPDPHGAWRSGTQAPSDHVARYRMTCASGISSAWSPTVSNIQVSGPTQTLGPHASSHLHSPSDAFTQGSINPTGQGVIRAHQHNVRAICPAPLAPNGMLPPEQLHWATVDWFGDPSSQSLSLQEGLIKRDTGLHGCNADWTAAVPASSQRLRQCLRAIAPFHGAGYERRLANRQSHHAEEVQVHPQQDRFRDRILLQAVSRYMDVVSCRSPLCNKGRNGLGDAKDRNSFLYPKPPKLAYCKYLNTKADQVVLYPYCDDHNRDMPEINFNINSGTLRNDHCSSASTIWLGNGTGSCGNHAGSILETLETLCEQSDCTWLDGMNMLGCLNYALSQYPESLGWFNRVIHSQPSHVEAISNAAIVLYNLNRRYDAEQHWLRALQIQPDYLETAELLVGLLYKRRNTNAINVISFLQTHLQIRNQIPSSQQSPALNTSRIPPIVSSRDGSDPQIGSCLEPTYSDRTSFQTLSSGRPSRAYAVAAHDHGRLLALIHAKGTMLYSMKDSSKAAAAFEEAVLISIGRSYHSIADLVQSIRSALAAQYARSYGTHSRQTGSHHHSMLLYPRQARKTAQLLFGDRGDLPGLAKVSNEPLKYAATQTTSNSLLSLAKILQDAMSNQGIGPQLLNRAPSVEDILALYYLSLSLQESPSTANNIGILLAGLQASPRRHTDRPEGLEIITGVSPGSGLDVALAYYQYGLRLDPRHVHLHTNLGSLLKDLGQLDSAIQMYEKAVSCDGTFDIALTNLANAVKDRGRVQDAIGYYRRAVEVNAEFPEAVCGLFTALSSVCSWQGRGGAFINQGQHDRWHVNDQGALVDARTEGQSTGLVKRVADIVTRQLQEASLWGLGVLQDRIIDDLVQHMSRTFSEDRAQLSFRLRQWAGKPWEGTRITRLVERVCQILTRNSFLEQHKFGGTDLDLKEGRELGKTQFPRVQRPRLPASLAVPPAPTVLPFHTFTCPLGAKDIRSISQRNATRISCTALRSSWIPDYLYPPPRPPNPELIVGYVSSDFNNHPLAHLMQSVFGFHDTRRIKAICYATTASDGSQYRRKIEIESPLFRDVSSWSPDKLADQIVADNVHILVNLNGYTRGARNEVFAARPAPVQMSFMGFAGSLGAEWCDYLLADSIAIPPETLRPWRGNTGLPDVFEDGNESPGGEWIYSENVIFCQNTFFCCDHAQSAEAGERKLTWEEEETRRWTMRKELFPALADDMIILGNFNQLYKIDPTTFRTWLRILARTPRAVLWLLRFPEAGEQHLRQTAQSWAGFEVAERLLFTDVAPKGQHIARARVCDLFLDTPECNAHTTAADVLWSSTPILTLPRYAYKMCSRMAASILRGALPQTPEGEQAAKELTASTEHEYENFAVNLAISLTYSIDELGLGRGSGRLADLRQLLWQSKWQCALFDTRRWVADVERAYEEAWRRWVSGEKGDIYLSDLAKQRSTRGKK